MPKYEMHKGYLWPTEDEACKAVIFGWQDDIDEALKHVEKKRVCIQAGGNCGLWPIKLADHFVDVHTFEPDVDNFHCLSHNVTFHKKENVSTYNAALGEKNKRAALHRVEKNIGAHWIEPGDEFDMIAIDTLGLQDVDLIMLDIEGYELKALEGAMNTIDRDRPVIVVEDKGLSNKYGSKKGQIEEWLNVEWGYEVVARPHRDVVLKCSR